MADNESIESEEINRKALRCIDVLQVVWIIVLVTVTVMVFFILYSFFGYS